MDWIKSYLDAAGYPDTPKNRSFLASWQRWEGGHTNNTARWNYLNTTQDMGGNPSMNSVGVKVYSSLAQGAAAFAKTIKNGRYTGLDQAMSAGDPYTKKAVEGLSVWLAGRVTPSGIAYASRVLGTHVDPASVPSGPTPSFGQPDAPQTVLSQASDVRAQALQGLGNIATGEKPTEAFSNLVDTIKSAKVPKAPPVSAPASLMGDSPITPQSVNGKGDVSKWVHLSPTADRKGVSTQAPVVDFVGAIAQAYGRPLTIGTGTNHNEYTVDGNVSDHWRGAAADVPAKGAALTRLGYLALINAGMSHREAVVAAKKGGLFNVGGYQIIFKTTIGGNHWNHLHVGLAAGR